MRSKHTSTYPELDIWSVANKGWPSSNTPCYLRIDMNVDDPVTDLE